jgi:hypothetical protein
MKKKKELTIYLFTYFDISDPGSRPTTGLKMCGNGIKEDGEDCDPNGKDTDCCDAKTCKFKPGAKCE